MACSAEHPLLTFQEECFGGKIWEALSWASTTVTSAGSPWHPTRLETNSKDREINRQALHREGDLGRVGLGVTTVCSRMTQLLPLCRDEQHILNLDHMTTWERAFHDSDQTKPSHQRQQEYTSSPKTPKSNPPLHGGTGKLPISRQIQKCSSQNWLSYPDKRGKESFWFLS